MEQKFSLRIEIIWRCFSIYHLTAQYGTEGLEVCLHYVPRVVLGTFRPCFYRIYCCASAVRKMMIIESTQNDAPRVANR
jgi:hypothetical protein